MTDADITQPGPSSPNGHTNGTFAVPAPPMNDTSSEIPSDLFDDLDPDDEIAYTLPVYMNQSLSPALNLFQYPLHHRAPQVSEWAHARGQTVTARMKEKVGRFELEIPIDMRPEVWDEERAEGLGFVPEDPKRKGKARDGDGWGNKMRLKSENVPEVTGYWAGVVHDGALHLHPVNRLQQLRPALGYLDALEAQDRAEKERARRLANGEEDDDDDDEPETGKASSSKPKPKKETEVKTVQLAMAQAPEDAMPLRRGSKMGTGGTVGTTTQIRNKLVKAITAEAEDTWVTWEWDTDSDDMLHSLSRLLLPRKERVPLECQTRPLDVISKKNIGEGARLIN